MTHRKWATSPKKVSNELMVILACHGYLAISKSTGTRIMRLTALQKEQTIQSVSLWLSKFRPGTIDLMLAEIRDQLEVNGLPPLRDEGQTEFDAARARGFKMFGKRREK